MEQAEIYGLATDAKTSLRLMWDIRKEWQEVERPLYRGKWFDYRFLNPVQATYLYAHHFEKTYRREYRSNISGRAAEYIRIFKNKDVFLEPKAKVSALWRGRQVADAMGMPYDLYLDRAFHWMLRFWNQKHLPRASQLYTDLVTDRTAVDWEARQNDVLIYSKLPQYKNDLYIGTPTQDDHHEWLFGQALRRGNSPRVLAQMLNDNVLPAEKIKARLGDEHFARVVEQAAIEPVAERYN
jgi:hypothetical protein